MKDAKKLDILRKMRDAATGDAKLALRWAIEIAEAHSLRLGRPLHPED